MHFEVDSWPTYLLLGPGILEHEPVGPLSLGGVQHVLATLLRQSRGEAVLLAADPALAGIVNLCDVAGGGSDGGALVQLDVGRSVDDTLDMEGRKRDEVCNTLVTHTVTA